MTAKVGRRELLAAGAAGGLGLALGFWLGGKRGRGAGTSSGERFQPNAFLAIEPDGAVLVWVAKSEMGQGVHTALPMLVAEELGADWSRIEVRQAVADERRYGDQSTVTSASVSGSWTALRRAGAAAREMLLEAAARTLDVDRAGLRSENGFVVHESSGVRVSHGSLARLAATLPVPADPRTKDDDSLELIGTEPARLDTPAKTDGSARFGLDVRVPDMLFASVERSPSFGGRIAHPFSVGAWKRYDADAARAVSGVRDVVELPSGVAVVALGTWAALQGRRALNVEWETAPTLSSADVERALAELAETRGADARRVGDPEAELERAAELVEATYTVPFLAHATMEPMNCTAHYQGARCEVWAPTQSPMNVAYEVASRTGLSPERVTVHTTYLGGGFGRRAEWDFCAEAALVSKAVGRPVQVVWTREDDVRHDFYRPAMRHRMRAALTASGEPRAWHHRVVGPSIVGQRGLRLDVDPTTVEGAVDVPYAFPHLAVETVNADVAVPVGFWRSVGHSHNAFAIECFTDEVAAAAGVDPVDWRRHLLRESPRHLGVLERVAAESSWGELLPTGRARGVALHASFGSFVAVVAEVEEPENGRPRVVRVTAAFDCGRCVHPGIAASQIEGGIVFALTAALHGRIEIAAGGAVQSNFHDYPLLRMDETPAIHVHRVESRAAPGGVGEIAVPPTAPAVANALSALRGERVRSLPLVKSS